MGRLSTTHWTTPYSVHNHKIYAYIHFPKFEKVNKGILPQVTLNRQILWSMESISVRLLCKMLLISEVRRKRACRRWSWLCLAHMFSQEGCTPGLGSIWNQPPVQSRHGVWSWRVSVSSVLFVFKDIAEFSRNVLHPFVFCLVLTSLEKWMIKAKKTKSLLHVTTKQNECTSNTLIGSTVRPLGST